MSTYPSREDVREAWEVWDRARRAAIVAEAKYRELADRRYRNQRVEDEIKLTRERA